MINTILPPDSPLWDPRLHHIFYASLAFQYAVFHLLANTLYRGSSKEALKKKCWILTTMASLVMCLASLPFLYDFVSSRFDVHMIRPRTKTLAEPLAAYFIAYLVSDLSLGSIYYRSMINFSSGWCHHIGYTFLYSFWIHKGWTHISGVASIFELPTLIMGAASLHPPLRSNMAFTLTFFATRVFFHLALLLAYSSPHGRVAPGLEGSKGPMVSIIITYPMHLWWGYKCILSVRRRMRKRKLAASQVAQANQSVIASAGQLFNGLPQPDVSSAVNTPASTTPGGAAINPGATGGPVHQAFAKAAAVARPPIDLLLPKSRRSSAKSSANADAATGRSEMKLRPEYINHRSLFTAPVAPEGAKPEDAEPFLAIRSPAEARDRARRLIADAVRKVWVNAPASWRKQFEEEARFGGKRAALGRGRSRVPVVPGEESAVSSASESEDNGSTRGGTKYLAAQRAAIRRAVLRAVRVAINGRDPASEASVEEEDAEKEGGEEEEGLDRTLQSLDFSGLVKLLPPDLFSQDYNVREYQVERDAAGGRRRRIVGQIRRRMEVARRDMVVF
ncbi:hypothetical protein IE53DRAFT_193053 [Violaceomyces palustris]|uniref:Uncharacterized protein n=1 Tax=Violaceomyces palustris TaxID=1673888 RepID=A0ACD0P5F9_9BASI|nr:hypothetical protein IE53DRAFT_193053 [Violaceomyces palustris]